MPNVHEMEPRLASHLARVSGKKMEKEIERINDLFSAGKISGFTRQSLIGSAAIRLAYIANVA